MRAQIILTTGPTRQIKNSICINNIKNKNFLDVHNNTYILYGDPSQGELNANQRKGEEHVTLEVHSAKILPPIHEKKFSMTYIDCYKHV